jgi:uncharacterized protein
MNPWFNKKVISVNELHETAGKAGELAANKAINYLDDHCREFIQKSPFLLLSTADLAGTCDVSPRGDDPGFVHILDDKTLLIPERPGNKRFDSMINIISNSCAGLLFIIPGLEETLRVNGKAAVLNDKKLMERMAVKGKTPLFGIGVDVEECFIHCAKAFKRSGLWQTEKWPAEETLPSAVKILKKHAALPGRSEESIEKSLEESYTKRLY